MLSIFAGPDTKKAEQAYLSCLGNLEKEFPEAKIITLDPDSPDLRGELSLCLESRDLFSNPVICRGRRIVEKIDAIPPKSLSQSPNYFIFLEPDLSATLLKKYGKAVIGHKGKPIAKSTAKNVIKPFAITEELLRRDRRAIWVEYQRSLHYGADPEDVYFKLQWQVRAMLSAKYCASAAEAGLHPFVYGKSKSALSRFPGEDLSHLSNGLLSVWNLGHAGGQEFELALEQFILSV